MTAVAKVQPINYERLSMSALRAVAVQTHPEHTDEAAREYMSRLIDLELERRVDMIHRRPGWHPHSPGFGDSEGRGTAPVDAMFMAYERGIPNSYWHDVARNLLGTLPQRRLMAVLIQAAKADHRLEGPFAATHDQIATAIGHYAQMLGFPRHAPAGHSFDCIEDEQRRSGTVRTRTTHTIKAFGNGQAIKRAAHQGKAELLMLVKAGV